MAVIVKVNGSTEAAPGQRIIPTGYSASEDSTPIDPTDTTGGVGQFTVGAAETPASPLLLRKVIDINDGSQGVTTGTIRNLSSNDGALTITADSRMNLLTATKQAQPQVGTLGSVFTYYLSLCGIASNYVIDPAVASIPVVAPGWNAVVWDQIKKLCQAYNVEVSLVSNNIVLRPLRTRIAENYRNAQQTWNIDNTELAQKVEINYYSSEYRASAPYYPEGGWNSEVPIYQVDAGEVLEVEIPLNVSLVGVEQPSVVLNVPRLYDSASVYAVAGNDGLPIQPQQWLDGGGALEVSIGEDTKSIKLKITGASEAQYAPYRIAMSAGPSDYYSSLRLIGTGVFTNKQVYTVLTGASAEDTAQEIGATVENEFINSYEQAFAAGSWAQDHWGRPSHTINVSTQGINRIGESGSYAYKTVDDGDAEYSGLTVDQFDTLYVGQTVDQFDQYWKDKTKNDFANQAFGNVAGARVRSGNHWFRIRSATITETGVSYTAQRDDILDDVELLWSSKTVDQFDAFWAGKTVDEFDLETLRA